jgi:hypothetical protein
VARHFAAGLCAATAGVCALFHHVVAISESVAIRSAVVANFSANGADASMELGVAQHEICRALAYLSTIEQQGNMLPSRMLATFV